MSVIPFAEWRPDMPSLSQWAREALNVVPAEESYRPLNGLSGVSNALTARCQGAAWFRGTAGATKMFAGDATKLYLLSGTTWSDVTQLAAAKAITAITKANPGKVTVTSHGYGNGDHGFRHRRWRHDASERPPLHGDCGRRQQLHHRRRYRELFDLHVSAARPRRSCIYSPGGDDTLALHPVPARSPSP